MYCYYLHGLSVASNQRAGIKLEFFSAVTKIHIAMTRGYYRGSQEPAKYSHNRPRLAYIVSMLIITLRP